jgi:hypothetical protein
LCIAAPWSERPHGPHARFFFAQEQALVAVVGNAALGLGGNLELPARPGRPGPAAARERKLAEGTGLVIDDDVQPPAARLEQADAIHFRQTGSKAGQFGHPALAIDPEQHHRVVVALGGYRQVPGCALEQHALAQGDVIQAPRRQELGLLALQVVDLDILPSLTEGDSYGATR